MSFGGAIRAVLATALLLGAAPSLAGAAGSPEVNGALETWRAARQALSKDRERYDGLARRIAALKQRDPQSPDLERLLQDSVAATSRLESEARTVDARARDVEERTSSAIRNIDAEIVRQKPGLHTGTLAERKEVARALGALNARRKELEAVLSELRPPKPATPKEWTRYEVKVDPLDGPRELRDKADFLEDTRDKFLRKREALAALIRDKRQERELNKMQQDFRRDLSHFDEEARTGRVTREGGAETTLSVDRTSEQPRASAQQPGGGGAPEADANASPAPSFGGTTGSRGATSPPPQAPNEGFTQTPGASALDDAPSKGPTAAAPPPAAPSVQVPGASASQLPKTVDPNLLLNLRVEDLAGGARDLKDLESLVEDLEKLDQFLLRQAEEIRRHAKRLEADEAPGKAP